MRRIEQPLEAMPPIGLAEMDSISLMNRMDTKYLAGSGMLEVLLERATQAGFLVLEECGQRMQVYRSMYYDTPGMDMYLEHHCGRLPRQKVRIRCYVSSQRTFLEVKDKSNHGRTRKKRMEMDPAIYGAPSLESAGNADWIGDRLRYPVLNLHPSIETTFRRITLVDTERTERITLDFGLLFRNVRRDSTSELGQAVIIEVKQDGLRLSRMREILMDLRILPMRLSKYCIGTALTDSEARCGNFKQKIRLIRKITERDTYADYRFLRQ